MKRKRLLENWFSFGMLKTKGELKYRSVYLSIGFIFTIFQRKNQTPEKKIGANRLSEAGELKYLSIALRKLFFNVLSVHFRRRHSELEFNSLKSFLFSRYKKPFQRPKPTKYNKTHWLCRKFAKNRVKQRFRRLCLI